MAANNVLILVADDEEMNRAILVRRLRKEGYLILEAKDGFEAVNLMHKSNPLPKLVLMDINMPNMDGIEATRLIKLDKTDIPIIAVTACLPTGMDHQSLGFDHICPKPIDFKDLLEAIERLLLAITPRTNSNLLSPS